MVWKECKTVVPDNSLAILQSSNICFCRVFTSFLLGYCKVLLNLTLSVISNI